MFYRDDCVDCILFVLNIFTKLFDSLDIEVVNVAILIELQKSII